MTGATLIDAEPDIVIDTPGHANPAIPERITTCLDIDKKLGSFRMNSLLNRYFSFHQISLNFKYKAAFTSKEAKTKYGLALMSIGRDSAKFGDNPVVDMTGGKGLFTFNPAVGEDHCFHPDVPTQVSYFEIDPDYFTILLMEQESIIGGALSKVKEKVLGRELLESTTTTSAVHHRIISDINNCPLDGHLGNLMLEGSLNQLIALQLAALGAAPEKNDQISIRDKEIMHGIHDHLQATALESHSLMSISKHFGINQGKLKKYFRTLFGVSVIEYAFNLKMEHARTLLHDKGMYVAEVSRIVGYKNSNHFATAFKRKFGVNPSRIRG